MIAIFNARSSIARALRELLPLDESIVADQYEAPEIAFAQRFLFCTGYLCGKPIAEQSPNETARAYNENFADIATMCDQILAVNRNARICIIGSESGCCGSYDMAYAGAKAAMHLYVERKRLEHPGQQLVAVSPTVIWDSGMTQARTDLADCEARGRARRRGEWLSAQDVAQVVHFALYVDRGNLCNTIIHMTGGNW